MFVTAADCISLWQLLIVSVCDSCWLYQFVTAADCISLWQLLTVSVCNRCWLYQFVTPADCISLWQLLTVSVCDSCWLYQFETAACHSCWLYQFVTAADCISLLFQGSQTMFAKGSNQPAVGFLRNLSNISQNWFRYIVNFSILAISGAQS